MLGNCGWTDGRAGPAERWPELVRRQTTVEEPSAGLASWRERARPAWMATTRRPTGKGLGARPACPCEDRRTVTGAVQDIRGPDCRISRIRWNRDQDRSAGRGAPRRNSGQHRSPARRHAPGGGSALPSTWRSAGTHFEQMARVTPSEAAAVNITISYIAGKDPDPPAEVVRSLHILTSRAYSRLQGGWPEDAVRKHWPHAFDNGVPPRPSRARGCAHRSIAASEPSLTPADFHEETAHNRTTKWVRTGCRRPPPLCGRRRFLSGPTNIKRPGSLRRAVIGRLRAAPRGRAGASPKLSNEPPAALALRFSSDRPPAASNACSIVRDTESMAGGMGRGNQHPIPVPPPARRHCWVSGPASAPGPHPGLIIEWARRDDGWWGLVTYVIEEDGALVQQWLPARLLTAVG
jgi:hypothetical protein